MRSNIKLALQIFLLSTFMTVSQAALCPTNIATTSFYDTPHWKDYCKVSWSKCSQKQKDKFFAVIHDRGSGIMPNRQIRTYKGKIRDQGKCDTTYGAAGRCLIPYITVAADPKFYRMGDIIEMPALKGRVVTLPDGKKMIHPGYFIVADVGYDIKGPNRFDFYTGTLTGKNPNNTFGYNGSFSMTSTKICRDRNAFTVIPRKDPKADTALASIENAIYDSRNTRSVASWERSGNNSTRGGTQ